jgi:hypothetical protein
MVKVCFVGEEEIDLFDKERLSFFNINSQDDLRHALRMAARGHGDSFRSKD